MEVGRLSSLVFHSHAVIHEVRNHLTALSVPAQMFPSKKGDPAFLDSFEKLLSAEIPRLMELTERCLERARPEKDERRPLDWGVLMGMVTRVMDPLFRSRGVRWKVTTPAGITVRGNACGLESLVMNLLRNALEAEGPGGMVKVKSARRGSFLDLQVENGGAPIPREVRRDIFDPFFSTKKDGTGLGLAICRKVVQDHGGTIRLVPKGSRTVFRVRLPLGKR